MKTFFSHYFWGIVIAGIFLVAGVATLSHYGINIDEPIHFLRGQAYVTKLITGSDAYAAKDFAGPRVSAWKIQQYNGKFFLKNDGGHPPINDIMAAATNRLLYERLGVLGDLESYHIFEIIVSAWLVFLVFAIARNRYGIFAGIVAAASTALYPLFLGESHFNIKDPVETFFFAVAVYFFYLGVNRAKGRFILLSSVFCGVALGTKFNVVFLPFIFVPYLLIRFSPALFGKKPFWQIKKIPLAVYASVLLYPVIVMGIFYATWPYLWNAPTKHLIDTILYYKTIGTGNINQPTYIVDGWNTYPVVFVIASTPPVILLFGAIGILVAIFSRIKEKTKLGVLACIWLIVPILRASWPGASIYSGVRQIEEYLPALAVLAGLGAAWVRNRLVAGIGYRLGVNVVILLSFFPLLFMLVRLHPNENLYLNSFVGGLRGAEARRLPGAGESMGNVYLQGIWWLNAHAEKKARLGLPVGLLSNVPRQFLRSDLRMGAYFSGLAQNGEYMMEMLSVDFPPPRYNIDYLNTYLEPIHVISVDGVPVLKIWKNEKRFEKAWLANEQLATNVRVDGGASDGFLRISVDMPITVVRVEIDHDSSDCVGQGEGTVVYSSDGKKFMTSPDALYIFHKMYAQFPGFLRTQNRFNFYFPAVAAKIIQIIPDDSNLCPLRYKSVRVYTVTPPK